ncbi:AAA-domain-containing protein [Coccomyxa subellipsoidea C-169]|uniref:Pachytene checkpoint protein 2 homolog n=1 Tax=Coccomyxa subellipsoidea (strain C-169) TaxID=574566 RepID=I0Z042_COCSC|nr:AAA-domain-containing protein [Coccomyxa subellipsoidea C-169]EIE24011.1 AAA-domain-containing protein [Coccomyxa subellipsoidea C-169]|eukprot:XP_005648555.1 AAA-domain-containing protein [Coccomyxa subellipsoidea C-169]
MDAHIENRTYIPASVGQNGKCHDDQEGSSSEVALTVEVCQYATSSADPIQIADHVRQYLSNRSFVYQDEVIPVSEEDQYLQSHVESIRLCDCETDRETALGTRLLFWQVHLNVHVFQLSEEGPADDDETEDNVSVYREWMLPAREFHNLWDSLLYEEDIKGRLLHYASTALLFGERGVDSHLVSFNRTVLLHGPPGTGKTTLCKALAQKLAVRFSRRWFSQGQLIEVNAHSLFSKWFSESGKLVSKLFSKIMELVEEEDSLVCVLLDEVESLTRARSASVSGSEPADAIRAVNALLTQLDALKAYPNVLVLTTSNITEAIDLAFVDRADIKAYVGPPGAQARYEILRSCVLELHRVGILAKDQAQQDASTALLEAAAACAGFSGRMLRKLPFLAHARGCSLSRGRTLSCQAFACQLRQASELEAHDRGLMK